MESTLLAGQSMEAIGDAERLCFAEPYREGRWALLARMLYACGRQSEALEVIGRLRRVLRDDLGIDPSSEVAGLELAILNQDPLLAVPAAVNAEARCPWPGLLPYDAGNTAHLPGRAGDIDAALATLARAGALALVGGSGVGKSSLARAGLVPRLGPVTIVTPGPQPLAVLQDVEPSQVLVVDQAEEVVTQCVDEDERRSFFDKVAAHPAPVIVVARADRLDQLSEYRGFSQLLQRGLFVVTPLDETGLREAIEEPADASHVRIEPGLVELLVSDCQAQPGSLPLLSHVLAETWRRAEGNLMTVAAYRQSGGISGALAASAEEVWDALAPTDQPRMKRLFLRLVADDDDPVRLRVPSGSLPDGDLVEALLGARLISSMDNGDLQIAHEALAKHWPRLAAWLHEDAEGHRLLRHLAAESRDWDKAGRPASQLYRGVRLDAAITWARSAAGALTRQEEQFLDASQDEADRALGAAHRTSRRLAILLVVAGLLLIATTGAAILAARHEQIAIGARQAAEHATAVSEGMRISTIAENNHSPSISLGLVAEALVIDDSIATRTHALEAFGRYSALLGTASNRPPWAPASPSANSGIDATSTDGTLRASAEGSGVTILRNGIQERVIHLDTRPNAIALSASGRLIAVGYSEQGFADEGVTSIWDVRNGIELHRFKSGDGGVWAHQFTPDESSVMSYGADGLHRWDLRATRAIVRTQNGSPIAYRAGDIVLSLEDPSVKVWIDLACTLAGRSLTREEWQRYLADRPYTPTCR